MEIKLHPSNMNRKDGSSLSKSWKPLICSLKEQEQSLAEDMVHASIQPSSARGSY
jgi:hypothetical protein